LHSLLVLNITLHISIERSLVSYTKEKSVILTNDSLLPTQFVFQYQYHPEFELADSNSNGLVKVAIDGIGKEAKFYIDF
jgi:hypothetical protein